MRQKLKCLKDNQNATFLCVSSICAEVHVTDLEFTPPLYHHDESCIHVLIINFLFCSSKSVASKINEQILHCLILSRIALSRRRIRNKHQSGNSRKCLSMQLRLLNLRGESMSKCRRKFMHTRNGCVFLPQLSESHLVVITSVNRISIEIFMIRSFTWGVVLGSSKLIFKNGVGTKYKLPIGAD